MNGIISAGLFEDGPDIVTFDASRAAHGLVQSREDDHFIQDPELLGLGEHNRNELGILGLFSARLWAEIS